MREELTVAIDELRLRSADRAWFIPLILSSCQVPDIAIGTGERLSDLHHVDLSADWTSGIESLTRVLLPNSLKLSKLLDKAERAARSGDQAGHLEALIEAARIAPDDLDVQNLIEAATRLGRHEDALDTLRRAAASDSHASEAQYRIGCVSWLGGRLDDALTAFGRAIKFDENNVDAYYDRSRLLYSLGLYDDALLCFERAKALWPENIVPRRARLRVLMTKGDGERLIGGADSAEEQFGAHADFCESRPARAGGRAVAPGRLARDRRGRAGRRGAHAMRLPPCPHPHRQRRANQARRLRPAPSRAHGPRGRSRRLKLLQPARATDHRRA
jgi:tetratricopeptide (TPR) repeat protein